jgi:hypothetical protein
MVSFGVMRH